MSKLFHSGTNPFGVSTRADAGSGHGLTFRGSHTGQAGAAVPTMGLAGQASIVGTAITVTLAQALGEPTPRRTVATANRLRRHHDAGAGLMPADVGYNDDVAEVESQTRIVGWVRAVFGLLARLVTANPFGDVARAESGTADGNAPVLDASARVASSLPSLPASRLTGPVPTARFTYDAGKVSGDVPEAMIPAGASRVRAVTAVRTARSVVRVEDAGQAAVWRDVPKMEISMAQDGGTLTFTLETTCYSAPGTGGGPPGDGGEQPDRPDPEDPGSGYDDPPQP